MKFYGEYPFASVSMSTNADFINGLRNVFQQYKIRHVVECGTYLGTGSTVVLAKAILDAGLASSINSFLTIEVDYNLYRQAKKNLRQYPFVKVVWGMSVTKQEALNFIRSDEVLKNHETVNDVFIDNINDPVAFYTNEINGQLFDVKKSRKPGRKLASLLKLFASFKEGVFAETIPLIKCECPLFLLDSAGGIGWLEFQKVVQLMDSNEYVIVLDDTHHVKHFRSLNYIKANDRFSILSENKQHGWVIAHCRKSNFDT